VINLKAKFRRCLTLCAIALMVMLFTVPSVHAAPLPLATVPSLSRLLTPNQVQLLQESQEQFLAIPHSVVPGVNGQYTITTTTTQMKNQLPDRSVDLVVTKNPDDFFNISRLPTFVIVCPPNAQNSDCNTGGSGPTQFCQETDESPDPTVPPGVCPGELLPPGQTSTRQPFGTLNIRNQSVEAVGEYRLDTNGIEVDGCLGRGQLDEYESRQMGDQFAVTNEGETELCLISNS